MKHKMFKILVLFLVILMTACAEKAEKSEYKDGTYTAEGDKRQYGYENATVTIKNGKITDIVLRRLTDAGEEVNYSIWNGTVGSDGKLRPNLNQYRFDIAEDMIEKQSSDVEIISGATDSSKGWMIAVDRALEQASV